MKKVSHWYLIIVCWGAVTAGVSLVVLTAHRPSMPLIVRALLDLITAGLVFWAGRVAKQQGAKPAGVGAIAGLVFGVVSGWPVLFLHVTRAQIVQSLHGRPVPATELATILKYANSPAAHMGSWGSAVIVGLILGLILGAIGGTTAKHPSAALDV